MIEHTYSWIVDGYLRATRDPGYCSVISVLMQAGAVVGTKTDDGYSDLEAL